MWRKTWLELHSRWQYKFWTDEDNRKLVERDYPQFLDFYDRLDAGIKRADFSRFLYMHRFGGVYVDLDFICLRELTPLLYGASIVVGQLSKDNFHYRIPNAFMASEPRLEFWLALATDAMNAPPEELGVERHAGPLRLQHGLLKYKPAGLRVLEPHLVYPLDWIHLTNLRGGALFRQHEHDLALRMHSMDLESIRREFPQSFAVTTWAVGTPHGLHFDVRCWAFDVRCSKSGVRCLSRTSLRGALPPERGGNESRLGAPVL